MNSLEREKSLQVELQGAMRCVKYSLLVFNAIFFCSGLALIITGTVIQTRFRAYASLIGSDLALSSPAFLLIGVGVLVFVVGFLGCVGAFRESSCLLLIYTVLLALVFILEISIGIAAFTLRGPIGAIVREGLVESLSKYKKEEASKRAWDYFQREFRCCGADNYTDWKDHYRPVDSVPDSCCSEPKGSCGVNALRNPLKISRKSCLNSFKTAIHSNMTFLAVNGTAVAILQVLVICFASILCRSLMHDYEMV